MLPMAQRVLLAFIREHPGCTLGSAARGTLDQVADRFETVRRRTDLSWSHHKEVAHRFEMLRRRSNLSWSHHREVAQREPTSPAGGRISAGAIRPEIVALLLKDLWPRGYDPPTVPRLPVE